MAFLTTRIQQHVDKGGTYRATFINDGIQTIKRINPLCDCIKYKNDGENYTFWYEANKTTNKIVVVTFDDNSTEFLELQTIINENQ